MIEKVDQNLKIYTGLQQHVRILEPIPKIDRNIARLFPTISNNAKE